MQFTSRRPHVRFPIARNISETLILYLLSMGAICQITCIWRVHSSWNLQPSVLRNNIVHGAKIRALTAHTRRDAISDCQRKRNVRVVRLSFYRGRIYQFDISIVPHLSPCTTVITLEFYSSCYRARVSTRVIRTTRV